MMGLAFLSSGLGPAQCLITVVSTQFLIRALPEVGSAPLTDELNSFLPYIRQTPRVSYALSTDGLGSALFSYGLGSSQQ